MKSKKLTRHPLPKMELMTYRQSLRIKRMKVLQKRSKKAYQMVIKKIPNLKRVKAWLNQEKIRILRKSSVSH